MKISAVSNNSFKGLWAKKINHVESRPNNHEYIYHYYPFKDESREEIAKAVESVYFRSFFSAPKKDSQGYELGEYIDRVHVHKKLDITKEEASEYLENHRKYSADKPLRVG